MSNQKLSKQDNQTREKINSIKTNVLDCEYFRPSGYEKLSAISMSVGIVLYLIVVSFLGKNHVLVTSMVKNFKTSLLWVVPQMVFFSSMLIVVLIAIFYGKKDESGIYRYKKKHKNVVYFFRFLFIPIMISMGFMLSILFIGVW